MNKPTIEHLCDAVSVFQSECRKATSGGLGSARQKIIAARERFKENLDSMGLGEHIDFVADPDEDL